MEFGVPTWRAATAEAAALSVNFEQGEGPCGIPGRCHAPKGVPRENIFCAPKWEA